MATIRIISSAFLNVFNITLSFLCHAYLNVKTAKKKSLLETMYAWSRKKKQIILSGVNVVVDLSGK